jgi:hypothetical protein
MSGATTCSALVRAALRVWAAAIAYWTVCTQYSTGSDCLGSPAAFRRPIACAAGRGMTPTSHAGRFMRARGNTHGPQCPQRAAARSRSAWLAVAATRIISILALQTLPGGTQPLPLLLGPSTHPSPCLRAPTLRATCATCAWQSSLPTQVQLGGHPAARVLLRHFRHGGGGAVQFQGVRCVAMPPNIGSEWRVGRLPSMPRVITSSSAVQTL